MYSPQTTRQRSADVFWKPSTERDDSFIRNLLLLVTKWNFSFKRTNHSKLNWCLFYWSPKINHKQLFPGQILESEQEIIKGIMVGRQQVKKYRFRLNKFRFSHFCKIKTKKKKKISQHSTMKRKMSERRNFYEICTHPYFFLFFSKRSRNNEAERVLVDPDNNSTEHSEIKCKLNITKSHPSPKLQS